MNKIIIVDRAGFEQYVKSQRSQAATGAEASSKDFTYRQLAGIARQQPARFEQIDFSKETRKTVLKLKSNYESKRH